MRNNGKAISFDLDEEVIKKLIELKLIKSKSEVGEKFNELTMIAMGIDTYYSIAVDSIQLAKNSEDIVKIISEFIERISEIPEKNEKYKREAKIPEIVMELVSKVKKLEHEVAEIKKQKGIVDFKIWKE